MATRNYNGGVIIGNVPEEVVTVQPPSPSPNIVKRLDKFDVVDKTWTHLPDMKNGRAGFALHHVNSILYAIGGTDGSSILKTGEKYDITTHVWTDRAAMTTARAYFASVVYSQFIYCIGGVTSNAVGDLTVSKLVERYDTVNNTWSVMASLPSGLAMGVAHVINGKIYVLSGYIDQIGTLNTKVFTYNISTNAWSASAALTDSIATLYRRVLPFSFVQGGEIYCVDGLYYQITQNATTKNYLYDSYKYSPTSGTVIRADKFFQDMPRPRFAGCSVSIGDLHYFMGGISESSTTLRWFEEVDATGSHFSFSDYTKLNYGRSSFGATQVDDEYGESCIFVAGGVLNGQNDNFLRVDVDAVPVNIGLTGKQTGAVNIHVYDENGESPSEIKVRLTAAANGVVLWTADEVLVRDGYGMATLLPRSEDFISGVMRDGDTRGYSIGVSGSIIDPYYTGETEPATTTPDGTGIVITNPSGGTPTRPPSVEIIGTYITVPTPGQNTQGSYLQLSNIGGFLNLQPTVFGSGHSTSTTWYSRQAWLPVVNQIISDNLGSYELMYDYLDRMSRQEVYGGSPLLDALMQTANVLQFDKTGFKKLIYVQTDGEENSSNATTDAIIDKLKQISTNNIPVVSSIYRVVPSTLHLDQGTRGGSASADKLADSTLGSSLYVITDLDIDRSIRSLLSARGFIGYGIFTCTIDLGEEVRIENITANFDVSDPDARAHWRYSVGDNDQRYTALSDRIEPNETLILFQTEGRFIKFIAEFSAELSVDTYAQGKLVPPRLTDINILYHKATTSYLYFKPHETDAQVHQLNITLDAQQQRSNEITVAASSEKSHNWDDMVSDAQPSVENSTRIVIPIRRQIDNREQFTLEALVPVDGFIFQAKYGKWAADSDVTIYDDSGNTVSPLQYRLFPNKGYVVFDKKRNNKYVIEIQNQSNITAAAKIVNRVHGEPVVIHGGGYFYSTLAKKKLTKGASTILPEAINLLITPLQPTIVSTFVANYTFYDLQGRNEKDTEIKWYINGLEDIDLVNLKTWDNRTYNSVDKGDSLYFTVKPKTKDADGRIVRSIPVRIG